MTNIEYLKEEFGVDVDNLNPDNLREVIRLINLVIVDVETFNEEVANINR